ncbi:hypothetical protein NOGI109294_02390 [Nocardiopsis gilva]
MAALGHVLVRPVRDDETEPGVRVFPGWLRQRVEAVIWTLKNQLGLERHNARTTEVCGRGSAGGSARSMPRSGTTGSSVPRSSGR